MKENKTPLVTIGIPTYNRANLIPQTIQSAVDQDYPNLEIIISDNASTDNTAEICKSFCMRYLNVIYFRQSSNMGGAENSATLLRMAKGDFFMWLGDDDWIDTNYIRDCVKVLLNNPDISIVAGQAKYYGAGDQFLYKGIIMDLHSNFPKQRVCDYFSTVKHNGIFYGVMPINLLTQVGVKFVLGGDLLMMASFAFKGKMQTLKMCNVHRRRGGVSSDRKNLAKSMTLTWLDYYYPRLSVARNVFLHIMYDASFIQLSLPDRFLLAIKSIIFAFTRKALSILFKNRFIEQSGM